MNDSIKGSLSVLLGAFLISFSPVFVGLVTLEPSVSAFYRVFFGSIILILILVFKRKIRIDLKKVSKFLLLAGVFFSINLWFFHRSVEFVGPGLATVLSNLQVLIVPFIVYLLFGDLPRRGQKFSLILSFSGLFLCLDNNLRIFGLDYQIGILLGILCAFAYSCYLISLKKANFYKNEQTDPFHNLMIVSLIASFILFFVIFIEGNSFAFGTSENFWLMVAYGTVSHVLGWYFIISGIQKISTVSVGIILISQPVFSFLWDVLLFNRIIAQMEIYGILIVLLAMIICIKSEDQIMNQSGISEFK